jgi:general secretion pathway protein H
MRPGLQAGGATDGFTLVEILVVVAILATLAVMTAPLLRHAPSHAQLRADVTRLAAALRITRAAAMAQNRDMSLIVDANRRTFSSLAVPDTAIDPRTEIGMKVFDAGGIRFFPSGRSTGGSIRLRLGQSQARVHVIWATGNVVVEE